MMMLKFLIIIFNINKKENNELWRESKTKKNIFWLRKMTCIIVVVLNSGKEYTFVNIF